jgi:hypothetical protein
MKEFLSHLKSNKLIFSVVAVIALLLVFKAGMSFGYHRALFNSEWGQNYYRNFYGDRRSPMPMMDLPDRGFMGMHGTVGTIIDISSSTISLKGQDNIEKSIVIKSDGVARRGGSNISFSDLKIGDNIAVIGGPNENGQVEAKFIRVFLNR